MITGETYFGRVIEWDADTKTGMVQTEDKSVYFFNEKDCKDAVKIRQLVAFQLAQKPRKQAKSIQQIYISKDKIRIIDRRKSHLHTGITPQLLKAVCQKITCDKQKTIKQQVNFDKPIGTNVCVKITDEDELIYAIRAGRYGHSQFVLNREPEPTNSMTIVLKKNRNHYKILTAYIGTMSELEPKDRRASIQSIQFWKKHALVFGSEPIIKDSLTKDCPWKHREMEA